MHGRLKVRTTEEQKLIKQKEQQQRLAAYRHGMKLIHATRNDQPHNKESFGICASILEKNPDVYTLWNYRKQVMLQLVDHLDHKTKEIRTNFLSETVEYNENKVISILKDIIINLPNDINDLKDILQSLLSENQKLSLEERDILEKIQETIILLEKNEFTADKNDLKVQMKILADNLQGFLTLGVCKLMQKELDLTERCLLVNPKSYGAWHHRFWILQNHPNANWHQELQLVEKYLRYDDRNFHTWDYRRLVLQKLGYELDAELQFSTDKINTNFSNYSSWHYRSTLRELSAETLEEELRLVQNAVFTDPYDSSTWFYLRWVLSNKAVTETHREALLGDFEQLLELEPNCKWIYLAKCWITGSLSLSNRDAIKKNVDVYKKLMKLDPMRKGMYLDYIKLAEQNK